jgi:hypothetical protein
VAAHPIFLLKQVGRVERILVTDTASDGEHFVGHNKAFDQVRARVHRSIIETRAFQTEKKGLVS